MMIRSVKIINVYELAMEMGFNPDVFAEQFMYENDCPYQDFLIPLHISPYLYDCDDITVTAQAARWIKRELNFPDNTNIVYIEVNR